MTASLDGYAYSFTSSWGVRNSVFDVVFDVVDDTEVTLTGDADTYVSFGTAEAGIALTGPGGSRSRSTHSRA